MQLIVYNDEIFLTIMTGKASGQTKVFSERRMELNSVLFRNESRESLILERGANDEKDELLEALLQAEVAMVSRITTASGELADGGLRARACGLGALPVSLKLKGAAG